MTWTVRQKLFAYSFTFFSLFLLLGIAVIAGLTLGFDEAILDTLYNARTPFLNQFFLTATLLADTAVVTGVTAGAMVWFWLRNEYFKALMTGVAVAVGVLLSLLAKHAFLRPRPELWQPLAIEPTSSFPSSHAAASMSLAIVIILLLWQTKWRMTAVIVGATYVFLVGISRVYLAVHYPTDVLGGWLLTAGWVLFLWAAVKNIPRHG